MPKKMTSTIPKPDAFDMFCFATVYYEGAITLFEAARNHHFGQHQHKTVPNRTLWGLFVPSSVLLSLSFEVYLKCLKRVRGKSPVPGHDTRKLYRVLSVKDQRLIRLRFIEHRRHVKLGEPILALESVFERTRNYFPEMRYGYERQSPRLPSGTDANGITGLDDAVEAVRWVILQSRTDWHQRYLDREDFL